MREARKLQRIHRVRTLQLGQVRAAEVEANSRVAQEQALRTRIAQLAAGVAPVPAPASAMSFRAAAHYRERLHHTAQAAERRVADAERLASAATARSREAKRDQTAVEKLIDRARARAELAEMRKLEEAPSRQRKRHDPC